MKISKNYFLGLLVASLCGVFSVSGESLRCHHHKDSHSHHIPGVFASFLAYNPSVGGTPIVYNVGQSIQFPQQESNQGITVNGTSDAFTIIESGDYYITFGVGGRGPSQSAAALFVNGDPVTNSQVLVDYTEILSRIGTYLPLQEGDVLSVRVVGLTNPITWNPLVDDPATPVIMGSLNIQRIR